MNTNKSMFTFLKNAAGMGLVEVMMAVAVTGGLTLTIAKMMENSSQSAKQIEAKNENISLKGLLQDTLNDTSACKNTFNLIISSANLTVLSGSPTASVPVPSIRDKTAAPGAIKYSTTSTNISPLTITSMELTNYNAAASTADLLVKSTFRKSSTMTMMVKPIRIPINFNVNPGPTLVACSTMAVGGEWMLGGNAGTVDGTDYIGTSDNQPLNFRVNTQKSGRIDSFGTTMFGYQAGMSLTTGLRNTGFGWKALAAHTTGQNNTAFGYNALPLNTTGQVNAAFGSYALASNTTGNHNIAFGNEALYSNTTGTSNIAIGSTTLDSNTTGNSNITVGFGSLANNVVGNENVAFGIRAASGVTTNKNVAIGYEAIMGGYLGPNTGNENTGVGNSALHNTRGGFNVAIGSHAGSYNDVGEYNTYLGYRSGSWAATPSGSRNIYLGAFAGNSLAGTNTTGMTTASDKLYVNNGNTAVPLIEGDFSSAGRYIKYDANGVIGLTNTINNNSRSSFVVGTSNILSAGGSSAFAAGSGNTVNGWGSAAIGVSNNVQNGKSVAIGWSNVVNGANSYALGAASQAAGDYAVVIGTDGRASHSGSVVLSDYGSVGAQSVNSDTLTARFQNGYYFYTTNSTNVGVYVASNGTSWASISDRNAKENLIEIDPEAHLKKIAKLPVFQWNYIGSNVPHMGPMAQDFYYIFKLGDGNDKVITTQDMEGVTIVAVKALEKRTRRLAQENEELKKRIEKLEAYILREKD